MKAGILDIIFENRNKAYGAYELRILYPKRLRLALGIVFLFATAFLVLTLWHKKDNDFSKFVYSIPDPKFRKIEIEPMEPFKKPELNKPVVKVQVPVNQKKFNPDILFAEDNVRTDKVNTIFPEDLIGTKNRHNAISGPALISPDKTVFGSGIPEIVVPKIGQSVPLEITQADIPPTYPGGVDALHKFLERNLRSPKEMEKDESVSVRIRFVVDYNGKLQHFITVLDGGDEYNKEVVRVLKKMPDWIPGKANGQNVSVYFTIPVKFVSAY